MSPGCMKETTMGGEYGFFLMKYFRDSNKICKEIHSMNMYQVMVFKVFVNTKGNGIFSREEIGNTVDLNSIF